MEVQISAHVEVSEHKLPKCKVKPAYLFCDIYENAAFPMIASILGGIYDASYN